jgi:hypothetical protein
MNKVTKCGIHMIKQSMCDMTMIAMIKNKRVYTVMIKSKSVIFSLPQLECDRHKSRICGV